MRRVGIFIMLAIVACGTAGCATHSGVARSAGLPEVSGQARAVDSPELIRRFVDRLPIGSTVTIELVSRERFAGVLMAVEPARIIVKPKTRIPEAARAVPFDQIVLVEPAGNGASLGRAAAIGAATGAGVFLGFFLWLLSALD